MIAAIEPTQAPAEGGAPEQTRLDVVQQVPLAEIVRSPFNRDRSAERKTEEWKEFVNSIRTHGIVQPLLGRPLPAALDPERKPGTPRLELVIGEGRWLGAREAQLLTVPVIVRQLSDREAIELQTIENDKRKDLTPIQQAAKYQQLLEQYKKDGLTAEKAMAELCAKLSKSKSTVYETLSLLKLPPAIKDACATGELPASHAALLVKLNDAPAVQERLARETLEPKETWHETEAAGGREILAFRELKELVTEEEKKSDARRKWEAAAAAGAKKGWRILTEDENQAIFGNYGQVKAPWLKGDDTTYNYSARGSYSARKWNTLMGKHAPDPVLGHDRDYNVIELYDRKAVKDAIAKNGIKKPKSRSSGSSGNDSWQKQEEERKRKAEEMRPVAEAATKLIIAAALKPKPAFPWQIFAEWLFEGGNISATDAIIERRGWKKAGTGWGAAEKTIRAKIAGLAERDRNALLVELMLDRPWDDYRKGWKGIFAQLCKYFGVDLAKIEKELAPAPEPKKKKPPIKTSSSTAAFVRNARAAIQPPVKKRAPINAAGRKRLAEAMRARWAARRADAKKGAK